MRVDDQHPEVLERLMPRRRQRQAIADAVAQLVGAGQDAEREREIGSAAGHRPDDRKVDVARHRLGAGRHMSARRNEAVRGFVAVDATKIRRRSQ
jgi:hypothetical protein